MKRLLSILLVLAGLGSTLHAQPVEPIAAMLVLGEWHIGLSSVPAGLKDTATDGPRRTFGLAFPIPLDDRWSLRPRYDDGVFSGSAGHGPDSTIRTEILQRHFGLDALLTLAGGPRRPSLYVGAGAGIVMTWHERRITGALTAPDLPFATSEDTLSPAFRVCAGLRLTPWLAVEAQAQTSSHRFQGERFTDTFGTLGLRLWPALLFGGGPPTPRM